MCHFEGRRKEPFARRLPIRAVEEHIVVEILEVLQVGAGQLRGWGEHIRMGHHTSGDSLRWMQGWFRNLLRSSQIAGSCQGWSRVHAVRTEYKSNASGLIRFPQKFRYSMQGDGCGRRQTGDGARDAGGRPGNRTVSHQRAPADSAVAAASSVRVQVDPASAPTL